MLIGNKVKLIPLDKNDKDYSWWFNDKEICKYNNHYRLPMVDILNKKQPDILLKIIYEGDWIGNISLQNIDYINRQAELTIMISSTYSYNKGCGTESCYLLVKHAFEELNLNRIYLGTHEENIGMQKIAEKLGFVKEGTRRKAIFKNGKYSDIIEYGILYNELIPYK